MCNLGQTVAIIAEPPSMVCHPSMENGSQQPPEDNSMNFSLAVDSLDCEMVCRPDFKIIH